ncbi:MAG: CYTH domain-containing protein [Thermodesulfobacteriota bacterium]
MAKEIERKFLVKEMPKGIESCPASGISQGYLAVSGDGTEIRIRKIGDRYYETVKSGRGLKREEVEVELSREAFETLWPCTEGSRVEKTRCEIPCGEHVIELDVYSGALDGLLVAEVEFKSVEESARFVPPEWLGREITDDVRYSNRSLAVYGRPEE